MSERLGGARALLLAGAAAALATCMGTAGEGAGAAGALRVEGAWPTHHQWSKTVPMVYGEGLYLMEMMSPPNLAGYAATYEFEVGAPGRYRLWLVGTPPSEEWVSPIRILLNGRRLTFTPASVGVHARSVACMGDEAIHWTRGGEVELAAGTNELSVLVMERRKRPKPEYAFFLDEILFAPPEWAPPESMDVALPEPINHPPTPKKTAFVFRVDAGKPGAAFPPFDFGLAQGAGHADWPKGFMEGITPAIRTLRPRYFRKDNFCPEWNAKERTYDFRENDRIVDDIRATGAEVIACIDIGHGPFREAPAGRVVDPDGWEEYCYEIAGHYNAEGKQGIRYWEVLNEPSGRAWYSNADHPYIDLFIRADRGIKRADPKALVGGPVTSAPETIDNFLRGCLARGVTPDFVSYHMYGLLGDQFIDLAKRTRDRAREITGNPELRLFVTEWGVQVSSADFRECKTSQAAAYDGSVLSAMARRPGCPDVTNLFMVKDIDYDYNKDGVQDAEWGMFSLEDQPRPSFFAVQLFFGMEGRVAPLEGDRTETLDGTAVVGENRAHVYLWNLEREGSERKRITLEIAGLGFSSARWRRAVIDPYCTNPYERRHANPEDNAVVWTKWEGAEVRDGRVALTFEMVPPGVTRVDVEKR